MEQKNIKDMKVGDFLDGFYLMDSMVVKPIAGGRSTIMLATLRDPTGTLGCKIWNYDGPLTSSDAGNVVYVTGSVGEYNNALQATLNEFRIAKRQEYEHIEGLVPVAPTPEADLWKMIHAGLNAITDPDYKKICVAVVDRMGEAQFRDLPAGKSVHHAFIHGLLMHTANMVQAALAMTEIYGSFINKDLLMAAVIFHDIGKLKEFDLSSLGLVSQYSVEGQLLGHLVIGAREVAAVAKEQGISEEKSILLQHMLLSHHGEPEFGAAVRPACAEAFLLHTLDLMDSHMETYREQLEKLNVGEMSNVIPSLGTRIYRHI